MADQHDKVESILSSRSPRTQKKETPRVNADVLEEYDIIFDKSDKVGHSQRSMQLENNRDFNIPEDFLIEKPICLCPHVNCPEKIIICLDLNEEMNTTTFSSRAGGQFSSLELARKSIRMFVMHKSQMNPNHEFALVTFDKEAAMIHPPTRNSKKLLSILDNSDIITESSEPLDLSSVFESVRENVELPVVSGDREATPPPYIVRLILIYGRSHSIPVNNHSEVQNELESSPYFFTDVLYIHKPLSQGNQCEDIFSSLCTLDHRGLSYIFEVSKYTPMLNCGAKLLAHPLQRSSQGDAQYKIGALSSAQTSLLEEKLH